MSNIRKMAFILDRRFIGEKVEVEPGRAVPRSFTAKFDIDGVGRVDVDVESEPGRARIAAVRVSEPSPGRGVSGLTIGRMSASKLLEHAVSGVLFVTANTGATRADEVAARVIRRRMSDERLTRVAATLAAGGGVKQVMADENVGDRQAWRLIKRAREVNPS